MFGLVNVSETDYVLLMSTTELMNCLFIGTWYKNFQQQTLRLKNLKKTYISVAAMKLKNIRYFVDFEAIMQNYTEALQHKMGQDPNKFIVSWKYQKWEMHLIHLKDYHHFFQHTILHYTFYWPMYCPDSLRLPWKWQESISPHIANINKNRSTMYAVQYLLNIHTFHILYSWNSTVGQAPYVHVLFLFLFALTL